MKAFTEYIFTKYAKLSRLSILKKYKKPLSPEERSLVYKKRAVWNDGSAAVWKSVNPKTGKTTYVTHTLRAYSNRPTIDEAIDRFHKFIKGTA